MNEVTLNGLTARRAQRGDLPRLLELLADDELGKNREGVGSDDPAYSRAFDVIDRDPVVGMLQVTYIPGLSRRGAWRANIEAMRIDSRVRGRGIGAWLMARALEHARKRGCRLAQLTSDKRRAEAHRFYARLGFVESHIGYKLVLEAAE